MAIAPTIKYISSLALNTTSYKAVVGAGQSGKPHPQILGAVRSAVEFANNNAKVAHAPKIVEDDKGSNAITVNADGVSDPER